MIRSHDLQRTDLREVEQSFIQDKFKRVRGPSVPSYFLDELRRIDKRLVLRWNPYQRLYMIFTRMTRSGWLWCQPVHVIQAEMGVYRKPNRWDLRAVAKAAWFARSDGSLFWQQEMDKLLQIQRKTTDDTRNEYLQEWARDVSRRWDLTTDDFRDAGVTRGVAGGSKRNRHKGSKHGSQ